ncbi:hypothetical protein DPEC_G00284110 [Dallia pectoralis]|uniref:Uncharacterized protein n=1 Tax=Dallia pectoralis TaxID=75939 RepID=A0ACC2FJF6_DALPE|nr:hypothetical protein DPEC_G00284110 [Dallia pectoralis]
MRRYRPGVGMGVYPFMFPSVISALPMANRPAPPLAQRLEVQQLSSSGSTPSPAALEGHFACQCQRGGIPHRCCNMKHTSSSSPGGSHSANPERRHSESD